MPLALVALVLMPHLRDDADQEAGDQCVDEQLPDLRTDRMSARPTDRLFSMA